jgi:RNA polymerase sigma factor (sigma-70 family)
VAHEPPRIRLLRGDEAELFREHEVALRAAVRHHVNTTDAIIEDACSFAWLQLLRRQPQRPTVFAWLRTVAVREAWRLHASATRDMTTDLIPADQIAARGVPSAAFDAREVLRTIQALSPHQRTVLTLFISGRSYDEISRLQNISPGSVNKALVRARRHLRLVHDAD